MIKAVRSGNERGGASVVCVAMLVGCLGLCHPSPALGEAASLRSAAEFSASVGAARATVAACAAAVTGCDAAALPADMLVRAADGHNFQASWLWLREAVGKAKASPTEERVEAMRQARAHLDEIAAQAGAVQADSQAGEFARAKPAAANILAGAEFQTDAGPSWVDRQVARLQDWFLRLLLGMDRVGTHNPWIAPLVEWTCFLLAAGGLLFFVRRSLSRQALRIALGDATARAQLSGRDTMDWARKALEDGQAKHWREGVHCLYWASIMSLENRRMWRPNPTRTPREYLYLLAPSSEAQQALRGLTQLLERIWYGHEEADEAAFRGAKAYFETIQRAEVQRVPAAGGKRANASAQDAMGAA